MYGGDEVSAIVLDFGSHSARVGYAGEESPKTVFPSIAGVKPGEDGSKDQQTFLFGAERLLGAGSDVTMRSLVREGKVQDLEQFGGAVDFALRDRLRADPSEHPLLLTESADAPKEQREGITEIIFEKLGAPAGFLAKEAPLVCYASGKGSGVVVSCGASRCTATPVQDGFVLGKGFLATTVAGDALADMVDKALEKSGSVVDVTQGSLVRKRRRGDPVPPPGSRLAMQRRDLLNDIKSSLCRVADQAFDEDEHQHVPGESYELPDGKTVELAVEKFLIPEALFEPSILKKFDVSSTGAYAGGLHQMVYDSVMTCDTDVRRDLFGAVIVTGGVATCRGLGDRLQSDLQELVPQELQSDFHKLVDFIFGYFPNARHGRMIVQTYKLKVLASSSPAERVYASWIGGSILASLGTFHQMWISKEQYDEHGAQIVGEKCP